MARQTKEANLTDKVVKYLDELQKRGLPLFYDHRSGSGGYSYKKGIPDLYIVINGIHIECELKAPDGKLSSMQEKFRWLCTSVYHMLYVCPRTLDDLKQFLEPYV